MIMQPEAELSMLIEFYQASLIMYILFFFAVQRTLFDVFNAENVALYIFSFFFHRESMVGERQRFLFTHT
jgi:hypothetical protein